MRTENEDARTFCLYLFGKYFDNLSFYYVWNFFIHWSINMKLIIYENVIEIKLIHSIEDHALGFPRKTLSKMMTHAHRITMVAKIMNILFPAFSCSKGFWIFIIGFIYIRICDGTDSFKFCVIFLGWNNFVGKSLKDLSASWAFWSIW